MNDIPIIGAEEHVRKHVEMYFGPGGACAERIAAALVDTALRAGATRVESKTSEGWSLVQSNVDWLCGHKDRPSKGTPAWEHPTYFPELGANAPRFEVMVAIFSDAAITWTPSTQEPIKGTPAVLDEAMACHPMPPWCQRAVTFRFDGLQT
ncbi:MAG: hypothetical protein AAF184_11780 [Pseudomonadota bacterium]